LSGPRIQPSSVRPRRVTVKVTGTAVVLLDPESQRWPDSTIPSSERATVPAPRDSRPRELRLDSHWIWPPSSKTLSVTSSRVPDGVDLPVNIPVHVPTSAFSSASGPGGRVGAEGVAAAVAGAAGLSGAVVG